MELNREHFCAIIFYNFRRGLTQRHHIDEVNSIFEDEAPSRTSVYVVVHSKKNFVKVVQNQLLFRKPLMLCANWYCKIVMWPIVTTLGICGTSIHSMLHEHLTVKKFFRDGSHTIGQSLKKRLSIGRKKSSKNTIAMLRNTSMTSWQVMDRGFTRLSPKVNNRTVNSASCLPRNQENQPPKTDHSSPRQCEFSHIGSNNCIFEPSKHRFDVSSAL